MKVTIVAEIASNWEGNVTKAKKLIKECKKAGSIYLTSQNEIGIFIKKSFQSKQLGNIALRKMIQKNPKKRYIANVNPQNKKSMRFFKNNGFKLIQYTFELSKT